MIWGLFRETRRARLCHLGKNRRHRHSYPICSGRNSQVSHRKEVQSTMRMMSKATGQQQMKEEDEAHGSIQSSGADRTVDTGT